jgi:hypothetical protein
MLRQLQEVAGGATESKGGIEAAWPSPAPAQPKHNSKIGAYDRDGDSTFHLYFIFREHVVAFCFWAPQVRTH